MDSLLVMLALGVLFLPGAAAAEGIQRSVDQQGAIHIGNTKPAGEGKAADLRAPSGPVAPEQGPKAIRRRSLSEQKEVRRKAILEKRQSPPPQPEAPEPEAAPAQPEQPPFPELPQGE